MEAILKFIVFVFADFHSFAIPIHILDLFAMCRLHMECSLCLLGSILVWDERVLHQAEQTHDVQLYFHTICQLALELQVEQDLRLLLLVHLRTQMANLGPVWVEEIVYSSAHSQGYKCVQASR